MSTQARMIYGHFRQLFAQVINSPIDKIRESIVVSLEAYVGPESNLLEMKPEQCLRIILPSPLLTLEEMEVVENLKVAYSTWPSRTLNIALPKSEGLPGYKLALERACSESLQVVEDGIKVIVLSDRVTMQTGSPFRPSWHAAVFTVVSYNTRSMPRSLLARPVKFTTCVSSSGTVPTLCIHG